MLKNYNKLRGKIRERGLTLAELARQIGMSNTSISNKLSGKTDFSLSEIRDIVRVLEISIETIPSYFFAQ